MPEAEAADAGFLLIDMALAMAVLLVLALVAWPALITRSTVPLTTAAALDTVALLRKARAQSGETGERSAVTVDLTRRRVSSAAGTVLFAPDLSLDFFTDRRCRVAAGTYVLTFLPTGRSCGGVLTIAKGKLAWRVSINWLTGVVDASATRS